MFGKMDYLKKSLDATWLKQEAISNNIANVNTPNYKRQTVEFNDVLESHMFGTNSAGGNVTLNKTNAKHIDPGGGFEPKITSETGTSARLDGNNVNIDVEMAEEAKNSIKYNYLTKQISDEFKRIRLAIRDGR